MVIAAMPLATAFAAEQPKIKVWCSDGTEDEVTFDTFTDDSYEKRGMVTKAVIPEGVTAIPDYAFSMCSELSEVELAKSITSIGDQAFAACTSLKEVIIPSSVVSIGDMAFFYTGIENIVIPENVDAYANITSTDTSKEAMNELAEYNSTLESRLDVVNISAPNGKITVGYTFDNTYWSHTFDTTMTDTNVKLGIILYNIPENTQVSQPMVFID